MKLLKYIFFILIFFEKIFSQGSIYSQYQFGNYFENTNTISTSMGSVFVANKNNFLNFSNPSILGGIDDTKFSLDFAYEYSKNADSKNVINFHNGIFRSAVFAFPISKKHSTAMSFELSPITYVNYSNEKQTSNTLKTSYLGSGGLSQFASSIAKKISVNDDISFSVGIKSGIIFGKIEKTENLISQITQTNSISSSVISTHFGNSFLFGSLINFKNFSCGISFSPKVKLDFSTDTLTKYFNDSNINSTPFLERKTSSENFTSYLPSQFAVGIASQINELVFLEMDFSSKQFEEKNYSPSKQFSLGIEFIPSKEKNVSYFKSIAYRFGGFFRQTHLTVKGEKINENAIAIGFGLPIEYKSKLNLSIEYLQRGDKKNVQENILQIRASIDGSEIWFLEQIQE